MTEIKPGDEARVFYWHTRRNREHPEGFPGTVTKVARKYGSVRFTRPGFSGEDQEWEIRFDLETGFQSPDTEGLRVRTLAQIEEDQRRAAALFLLDAAGLEIKLGRQQRFTLEQLEALAEVVKTWDA